MASRDPRPGRGNLAFGVVTVELSGVSFSYTGSPKPALCEVSARFSKGEITVVTGRLGAGCSTLLQVISGLIPGAVGGHLVGGVRTLGIDPTSDAGRHQLLGRVGLLLSTPWTQLSGMSFTVTEEVAFGPANLGWERERITSSVEHTLSMFGLHRLGSRNPQTLSGGELQRVMLASVVAMEPEVLLLDEPFQALDPSTVQSVAALLPELARHAAVIVASTEVDDLIDVADRVHVLEDGVVFASGTPDETLRDAAVVERRLSTTVAELSRSAEIGPPFPISITDLEKALHS